MLQNIIKLCINMF